MSIKILTHLIFINLILFGVISCGESDDISKKIACSGLFLSLPSEYGDPYIIRLATIVEDEIWFDFKDPKI